MCVSQVLIFLDSHCEVNKAWLEPLLSHIKNDRRNVAIPIIDIINQDSFAVEASPLVRGGFNWGLFYRWDPVPQSTLRANDSFISPIKYTSQLYLSHWSNFSLPVREQSIVMSMSVCVSVFVCEHISGTACPNVTKFSVLVACCCESVLLCWHCDTVV